MTELADVQDLGSCAFRRVGSSPTNRRKIVTVHRFPANCNIRSPHLKFCFAKEGCSHLNHFLTQRNSKCFTAE